MKYTLTQKQHIILSKLYSLRIMSFTQIYEFIFETQGLSLRYCTETLKKMVASDLIEKIGYYNENAYYFITRKGISCLKENGVILVGKKTPEFLYEYKTAAKLKIEEVYTKHQLMLNQFVLEYERDNPEDFEYYDEIYTSLLFASIRPDGIIKKGNTYYFLETDMNTERKQRLMKKWENYRKFATSQDYLDIKGDIKVLFILEGVNDNSKRIINLREYIHDNLNDLLCPKFDILINPRNHILNSIENNRKHDSIIKAFNNFGYETTPNSFSVSSLLNHEYMTYAFMPTQDGHICTENGEYLEFLIDDYTDNSCYVTKKIKAYGTLSSIFQNQNGRTIKYVIILPSEQQAYQISKLLCNFENNIYYSTIDRLKYSDNIYKALFKVTSSGVIYHFADFNLKIPVTEYTLPTKFIK